MTGRPSHFGQNRNAMRWRVIVVRVFNDGYANFVGSVKEQHEPGILVCWTLGIPGMTISLVVKYPERSAPQLHTDGAYGRYCRRENKSDAHELGDGLFIPGESNSALHVKCRGGVTSRSPT